MRGGGVELQISRFHNLARRVLNLRGPEGQAFGELGGITGELDLLRPPLPEMLHAGWRAFAIGVVAGGDATHPGQISLSIPPESEIMIEITYMRCRVSGGTGGGAPNELSIRNSSHATAITFAAGGATNPVGVGRDTRIWKADFSSNCSLSFTSHVADAGVGVLQGVVFPDMFSATEPLAFFTPVHNEEDGFVITPGKGLTFTTQTNNQSLKAWICWRERNVERGELQISG